ncbi:hypothetical protein [Mycolicibacterium lacusdiani]|uniref:hypothetical protein n=1 Tax=Mycolicibacterium lacusdiani TaxID=2895283 RepID=UPI001F3BD7DE|nr:hypothetical protein [Mycolicibacterium lacusdiani]
MTEPIDVRQPDLATAWLDTILAVAAKPQHRAFHTVTRIDSAGADGHDRIYRAADDLLTEFGLQSVSTVANTIFPVSMVATSPDPVALGQRYEAIYPELRRLAPGANRDGTYFLRLVAYPGPAGTVNQLARVIAIISRELDSARPKRARYEATVEIPVAESGGPDGGPDEVAGPPPEDSVGVPIFEPRRDTSAMGFPCLSFLSFQHDTESLHTVAHYRSQYVMERGLGNYLGIARLHRYVAGRCGLRTGILTVVAGQAHADKLRRDHVGALQNLRDDLTR